MFYTGDNVRKSLILVTCAVVNVIVMGFSLGLAVVYVHIIDVFQTTRTTASLVQSLCFGITFLGSFITGPLAGKLGPGVTTMLGSATAAVGVFVASFASDVNMLIAAGGFLTGLGMSLIYPSQFVTIGHVFGERKTAALSAISVASGLGGFIFAFLNVFLLHQFGWRGTLLISSAVILNCFLGGLVVFTLTQRNYFSSCSRIEKKHSMPYRDSKSRTENNISLSRTENNTYKTRTKNKISLTEEDTYKSRTDNDVSHTEEDTYKSRTDNNVSHTEEDTYKSRTDNNVSHTEEDTCKSRTNNNVSHTEEDTYKSRTENNVSRTEEDTYKSRTENKISHTEEGTCKSRTENNISLTEGDTYKTQTNNNVPKSRKENSSRTLDNMYKSRTENDVSKSRTESNIPKSRTEEKMKKSRTGDNDNICKSRIEDYFSKSRTGDINMCKSRIEDYISKSRRDENTWKSRTENNDSKSRTQRTGRYVTLTSIFQPRLFKDFKFVMFLLCGLLIFVTFPTLTLFLVDHALHIGLDIQTGSFLLSIMSVSNICGRLIGGFVNTTCAIPGLIVYAVTSLLTGVSMIPLIYATGRTVVLMCVVINGLVYGVVIVSIPVATMEVTGLEQYAAGIGYYFGVIGLGHVLCGPLGGGVKDYTGSYNLMYYMAAGSGTLSALLLTTIEMYSWARRRITNSSSVLVEKKDMDTYM